MTASWVIGPDPGSPSSRQCSPSGSSYSPNLPQRRNDLPVAGCCQYSPALDPGVAELRLVRRVREPQVDLTPVGVCPLPCDVPAVHRCRESLTGIFLEEGDITS